MICARHGHLACRHSACTADERRRVAVASAQADHRAEQLRQLAMCPLCARDVLHSYCTKPDLEEAQ